MYINSVVLTGNITRDPELKYVPSGKAVVNFSIAVNMKLKDREETSFINIEAWEKQAEIVEKYLKKGSEVGVQGRLKQRTWEKDGQKRSVVEVVAERIHLGRKKED